MNCRITDAVVRIIGKNPLEPCLVAHSPDRTAPDPVVLAFPLRGSSQQDSYSGQADKDRAAHDRQNEVRHVPERIRFKRGRKEFWCKASPGPILT